MFDCSTFPCLCHELASLSLLLPLDLLESELDYCAVTTLAIVGDIWKQVQLGSWLHCHLGHKERHCWVVSWGHNVGEPEGTHIEPPKAELPEQTNNQAIPNQQKSVNAHGISLLVH